MHINFNNFVFDLTKPISLAIPLHDGPQVNCYFAPPFSSSAVVMGDFIGDTGKGGLLNYKNIALNPHGNGTHTECLGHICDNGLTINQALKTYHVLAQILTVTPEKLPNGDSVISAEQLKGQWGDGVSAIVVRTRPNSDEKLLKNYNNTNPPYFLAETTEFLANQGINHLLVDLPSVDREEDGGKLLAHRAFWQYPENPRLWATLTELIYVPDEVADGTYLLNLQIAAFELDAAPSNPVIFAPIH